MTNLCVCPPFKKSFTSAETPGPGLWRLYISIHNWWPRPRQTAHYTCNMDSVLVSDACPHVDLTLSHHCVWRRNGEGMLYVNVRICVSVCVCCNQKWNGPTLCSPAPVWRMFWLLIPGLVFQFSVFLKNCFDFLHDVFWFTLFGSCGPKHLLNK